MSAILDLILTKPHTIHGRIVVNACVKYRKQIFISVGDIHPDRCTGGRKAGRSPNHYPQQFLVGDKNPVLSVDKIKIIHDFHVNA